jgi:hypothetical protein
VFSSSTSTMVFAKRSATISFDCGADVVSVRSGDVAMLLLAEAPPDVLISDIGMPGHDGIWLIRAVRAPPREQAGDVPARHRHDGSPRRMRDAAHGRACPRRRGARRALLSYAFGSRWRS